ncbi:MAG: NUDIX domain-containing protein [Patescibacteria group bacterium]|nr:NUDIX domain-containing protein [Patescibacteria group bacterium]
MSDQKNRPRVGLGVIIVNQEGKILIGKRKNSHAPYYSIPGGHLDPGETFEAGAIREIKEEMNLDLKDPKVIAVTNNLETYRDEGLHYISIILLVTEFSGDLKNMEPEKCEEWLWVDPNHLPSPHFDASRMGVACYLEKAFYKKFE